jgi:hypothetical protein
MLTIDEDQRIVDNDYIVIAGTDTVRLQQWLAGYQKIPNTHIFIEAYRPRSHFNTDARMTEAVNATRAALPGSIVLLNTGVKKVVKQPLMELLGVWKFSTPTHHQDLRSAARIALLGALRDDKLNRIIADIVRDHINGNDWCVTTA